MKQIISKHQNFFKYFAKNYSPIQATKILEIGYIEKFDEKEKFLSIFFKEENDDYDFLKKNLLDFQISISFNKKISLLTDIKEIYKQKIIDEEMQSDNFKELLKKYPNAKIHDVEIEEEEVN